MIRAYIFPVLAIAGAVFGVVTAIKSSVPPPATLPVVDPPKAPYTAFVAGSGLVEPSSQNILVGTPVGGVVTKVNVIAGAMVNAGDVLFQVDDREQQASLQVAQASLAVAKNQLEKLRSAPRTEEVPPAEARVKEAESNLADLKNQLDIWERVNDPRAVSVDDLTKRRFAVAAAEARLTEARAQLALLKAGTWKPDLAVAEAQVFSAQSQVNQAQTEVDRRVIKAPVSGQVLQVNVRSGEFAQAGPLSTPLMIMGAVDPLHVRVDIDEHDAWRVRGGSKAVAFVRGNKDISTELEFVRFEPYVVPKKSLTGESTERVDTRVLQALYRFKRGTMPIYVGQQMDVYIESEPLPNDRRETTPPAKASSQT
jgi:multidrug resistance efflux pump